MEHPRSSFLIYSLDVKVERFVYVLKNVDIHCRRTLSLYNSTRSTSVQEDHFHSVYFAAGMAWASLPRRGICRRCPQRAVLVGLHYYCSLWGLKAHGTALSFVPPKNICYSRRTRKTATALHRTKKIDLYFRGVAAFRSNQRGSASN